FESLRKQRHVNRGSQHVLLVPAVLRDSCELEPGAEKLAGAGHYAEERLGLSRTYAEDRARVARSLRRRNLEDHHLIYRSRLGADDLSNRVCPCRYHHARGERGGLARCRGAAPNGILWRLGRRELGAWYRNERRLGRG